VLLPSITDEIRGCHLGQEGGLPVCGCLGESLLDDCENCGVDEPSEGPAPVGYCQEHVVL
jgi:hypothetical protein